MTYFVLTGYPRAALKAMDTAKVVPQLTVTDGTDADAWSAGEDDDGDEPIDVERSYLQERLEQFSFRKQTSYRRAISRSTARSALNASAALAWRSRNRDVQSKVDWSERATPGDHIWVDHLASGDFCYVTDNECFKMGPKKRCTACHMVAHTACIGLLEQMNFKCKPTFREAGLRNYRDSAPMRHHWVHRRKQEGKCRQCAKSFTSRFGLSRGEIVAISCSWCKQAYHNKVSCFSKQQIEEPCSLGLHAGIVVPPNWIIRSRPSTLKSSIRHHGSTRRRPSRRKKTKPTSTPSIPFLLKPIPAPHLRPLLVFINPRSGGQLGAKLLHKFHWLLNPRQVFDLTDGGPHFGLELYRKVPNLRVLACGGDGTVGWVLSAIDQLRITPPPPVAILPLGTGNDLARTLNWGGGYTDEPLSKVLCQVEEAQAVLLDRWQLTITPNPQATNAEQEPPNATPAMDRLPLDVFNNYFSVGADAAVALEFHESREANPEKFNNRLRNKMFYAGAGGRDLLKRSWRDLSDFVKLECDGKDVTQRLHELKIHCLLFLNIPRYAGGTVPWVSPTGFDAQRHDDGRLEVIGFSTASLAALQFGGSGSSICQCREVVLRTLKTIPAQVDGEPCRLKPTVVRIQIRSQSAMLAKLKRRAQLPINELAPSNVRVQVRAVSITAYESLYNDKDKLRTCANSVGAVSVENAATLDQVRRAIDRLMEDDDSQRGSDSDMRNTNWVFLDHVTADRFFRVDRAQEHLHYVTDISSEELFILNPELDRSPRPSVHEHPSDTPALDSDATLLPRSSSPRNECPPGAPCSPTSELMVVSGGRKEASEEARKRGIAPELFERARNGDLEQIVSLTENGATLHCRDESGQTLMHVAARRGHAHIVRWLIDNAPKELLFTKDFVRGQTALHCAAQSHRKSVCVLLLDAGAEITTADHQGRTPRNLAQSTEDVEVASYLEMQERISGEDQETAV